MRIPLRRFAPKGDDVSLSRAKRKRPKIVFPRLYGTATAYNSVDSADRNNKLKLKAGCNSGRQVLPVRGKTCASPSVVE